jgi:hypothetical protein
MFRRRISALLAACVLSLAAAAAQASVIYDFTGSLSFGTGSFLFEAPSFITSDQQVTPSSCSISVADPGCGAFQELLVNGFNTGKNLVNFQYEANDGSSSGGSFFFFDADAFTTVGTHIGIFGVALPGDSGLYGSAGESTLTVRVTDVAVPEPATAALLGGGLFAVLALRRRSRTA